QPRVRDEGQPRGRFRGSVAAIPAARSVLADRSALAAGSVLIDRPILAAGPIQHPAKYCCLGPQLLGGVGPAEPVVIVGVFLAFGDIVAHHLATARPSECEALYL